MRTGSTVLGTSQEEGAARRTSSRMDNPEIVDGENVGYFERR